jgi:hypothetical protein
VKFILMDYVSEAGWPQLSKCEQEHWLGVYLAYVKAMKEAGVLQNGVGLQRTSAAKTVRVVKGKSHVTDGPYAETKEQLGGFHIIDVADVDAALAWPRAAPPPCTASWRCGRSWI